MLSFFIALMVFPNGLSELSMWERFILETIRLIAAMDCHPHIDKMHMCNDVEVLPLVIEALVETNAVPQPMEVDLPISPSEIVTGAQVREEIPRIISLEDDFAGGTHQCLQYRCLKINKNLSASFA